MVRRLQRDPTRKTVVDQAVTNSRLQKIPFLILISSTVFINQHEKRSITILHRHTHASHQLYFTIKLKSLAACSLSLYSFISQQPTSNLWNNYREFMNPCGLPGLCGPLASANLPPAKISYKLWQIMTEKAYRARRLSAKDRKRRKLWKKAQFLVRDLPVMAPCAVSLPARNRRKKWNISSDLGTSLRGKTSRPETQILLNFKRLTSEHSIIYQLQLYYCSAIKIMLFQLLWLASYLFTVPLIFVRFSSAQSELSIERRPAWSNTCREWWWEKLAF